MSRHDASVTGSRARGPNRSWPALVGFVLLAACGARAPGSIPPADLPEPTTLARTGWPNDWLICPAGACTAPATAAPPAYPVPPERLFAAWREVVSAQPRATLIGVDDTRMLLLTQDRTPLLGFIDDVSIRVLPAPDGGSTFAAYSRSNVGMGDFGTNRRRLEQWSAALARTIGVPAKLPGQTGSGA
ncbi:MAG: DUF1499 domain-containing protein [Geminicoccaceae bacterium]